MSDFEKGTQRVKARLEQEKSINLQLSICRKAV